jgi:cytoskeleton protein RodZ
MAYHSWGPLQTVQFRRRLSGRENLLPSFGQKLKREREKRAITLEQISSSTKIGTRMLQALEEENFDQLPGGIFNKGFIRAYARHVGLDEDQAIADYLEASGQNVAPKPDSGPLAATAAEDPHETAPSWQIPRGWLAAGLLVLALALSLWSRWQHKRDLHPELSTPTASTANSAEQAGAQPASAAPPNGLSSSTAAHPPEKAVSPESSSTPASASNVSTPTAAVPPATAAGEFTVVILAHEDSWLSIIADGNTIFEGTLVAENQHAVHGRNELVIRAGNTGGLDFVFNGKKLPSQGDYGEVKTLTFRSSGLQPKTPSLSPTQ